MSEHPHHDEYTTLVREHRDRLVGLAYRICRDRGLAEDAVSEAFARLWVVWGRIDVEHPAAYASRMVRNEVIDRLRQRGREEAALRRAVVRDAADAPADRVDASREVIALWPALPERYRTAVALRYLGDFSNREVAEFLDLPVGTVKSHASRGLAEMRRAAAA